jgi:hypothetical protein
MFSSGGYIALVRQRITKEKIKQKTVIESANLIRTMMSMFGTEYAATLNERLLRMKNARDPIQYASSAPFSHNHADMKGFTLKNRAFINTSIFS